MKKIDVLKFKTVTQALPTYTMSTFEVTYQYLWQTWCPNKEVLVKKYLAWKAWDNMCLPRKERGLGFKKSKEFNRTLITKLSWVVASKRESVCMRLLRCKYKVRGDGLGKARSRMCPLFGGQLRRLRRE